VIRWAGSKRLLLPQIHRYLPSRWDRYLEPFVGSGCLFFSFSNAPAQAILGDINKELIETYEQLAQHPVELHGMVNGLPEDKPSYYWIRSIQPHALTPLERAARFIYLNRFAFNAVYRVNRRGEFNVPRGKNTGALPTLDQYHFSAARLKRTKLYASDFEGILQISGEGDFVYLDPPYAKAGHPRYGEYGYQAFSEDDIGRFVKAVKAASRRGAKILISYAEADGIRRLFKAWNHHRVLVRRNVAGFLRDRRRVAEVLLTNY
jgi:DNA adenine methylase